MASANQSKKVTVLFVDDSSLMRRAAQCALTEDYEFILAGRVRQLLAAGQGQASESRPSIESVDNLDEQLCIESSADDLNRRLRQSVAMHVRHDLLLSIMQMRIVNINDVEARHGQRVSDSVMKFAQKILGQTLRDEDSVGQTKKTPLPWCSR